MDNNNNVTKYVNGYSCDPVAMLNNSGIQRLQHDVGETNRDVKDSEANIRYGTKDSEANIRYAVKDSEADIRYNIGDTRRDVKQSEANIRHDVLFEGQESQKTSLEVEARLKDRLTIDRNAWDLQFQNLNDKICSTEKETIKMGYEGRLETIRENDKTREKVNHLSERLTDKVEHTKEEIREDIGEFKGLFRDKVSEIEKIIQKCCCESELANATQSGLLNQLVSGLLNVK